MIVPMMTQNAPVKRFISRMLETLRQGAHTNHDVTSASKLVTPEKSKDCSSQTTHFVDGCVESLHCRGVFRANEFGVEIWEGLVELFGGNNTRHDTLIIAKQQKA